MSEAIDYEKDFISVEEYLEGEPLATVRHEYVGGRVIEMAGATEEHETVASNLFVSLYTHLRGRPCRAFKGEMKLRLFLNETELFYYPDILVTCDPRDTEKLFKRYPKALVEVMSNYKSDHVEKLFAYQQIETLEEYLVVDQNPETPQAWIYRKESGWKKENGAPDGVISLQTVDFSIPLADLYVV